MQFRIGKLGAYAMASPRYSNIPFQGWDIKPDLKKYVLKPLFAYQILISNSYLLFQSRNFDICDHCFHHDSRVQSQSRRSETQRHPRWRHKRTARSHERLVLHSSHDQSDAWCFGRYLPWRRRLLLCRWFVWEELYYGISFIQLHGHNDRHAQLCMVPLEYTRRQSNVCHTDAWDYWTSENPSLLNCSCHTTESVCGGLHGSWCSILLNTHRWHGILRGLASA